MTVLLHDTVQDYLNHITHERRLALTTTVTGYRVHLQHFLHWLEDNGYPTPTTDAFTVPVLRRYLYFLSGKGLRPRTIRSYFHPLTGLGEFLVTNELLDLNPTKSLTMPKKDAAQRLLVSDEEVIALLQACERQPNPKKVALSRALLSVLVYARLRRQELLDLHVPDVLFDQRALLVHSGKGSKSRIVYVCEPCLIALREWLAFRPTVAEHDSLWAYDRRRRIAETGLDQILGTIKAIAGFADRENIKPHSLRHNYASRLLKNGADIKSIQASLGHAQLSTTAIYLHLSEEAAKSAAHFAELPGLTPRRTGQEEPDNVIHLPARKEETRSRRIERRGFGTR